MEEQLLKTEMQPARAQSGVIGLARSLFRKLVVFINSSTDKTKDKEYLDWDLFSQMAYMASISSSGLSRDRIFQSAARLPYSSSSYFRDVNFLVQKLNYDYPEACRVVGENTKEQEPRAILLRMAGALSSGEPEQVFLAREAYVQGETYGNSYERTLQTLKTWTDAYVALTLSASLIVIVSVIAMMIYPVQTSFVVVLAGLSIIATVAGAWVIYRSAPKEIKTHSLPERSSGQNLAGRLFKLLFPAGLVISLILAFMNVNLGWVLLVMSAVVLPPGLIIIWDDRKVDKHDNDIAGFLRSLGGTAKAVSTTVSDAVSKLDVRSTGSLQKAVRRLNARIHTGVSTELAWLKFVGETGSEHVHRSVQIFRDAVEMGADAGEAGNQSSLYAMKIALLRARRRLVSFGFSWLVGIMHGVTCGLMLFLCGVLTAFAGAIKGMGSMDTGGYGGVLPTFGFFGDATQLELFRTVVLIVIVVFTVANAFVIRSAEGGHHYKFLFYFGILAAISGIAILVTPALVGMALGGMAPVM